MTSTKESEQSSISNKIEVLESQEQELIQHIRTSGLRKPREIFLIDSIMDLRKYRRQLVHDIMTNLSSTLKEKQNLEIELHQYQNITKEIKAKDAEIESLRNQNQDIQTHTKELLQRMQFKYQTKVTKLETKLKDFELKLNETESNAIETRAIQLKKQFETEIHEYYSNKLSKYDEEIKVLSAQEKSLSNKLQQVEYNMMNQQTEYKNLSEKYSDAVKTINDFNLKEKSYIKSLEENENLLYESKERIKQLESDKLKTRNEYENKLKSIVNQLELKHENNLKMIDQKIRKLIDSKDTMIQNLKESLSSSEKKRNDLEQALIDINRRLI